MADGPRESEPEGVMPIYVYQCPECDNQIEKLCPVDARPPRCECDGLMRRVPTSPAIRFSGSGWQTPSPSK